MQWHFLNLDLMLWDREWNFPYNWIIIFYMFTVSIIDDLMNYKWTQKIHSTVIVLYIPVVCSFISIPPIYTLFWSIPLKKIASGVGSSNHVLNIIFRRRNCGWQWQLNHYQLGWGDSIRCHLSHWIPSFHPKKVD